MTLQNDVGELVQVFIKEMLKYFNLVEDQQSSSKNGNGPS